ncbi:hypothetical protein BDP81DRAFT_390295 [Colletotrichum phormii]|uniref:Uncharacterized protein n=1 Tax=Colletotrichum phormii TaxID=359342 RepID=A0AAJ0EHY3_9PEZI|nr:uncharacterized protein BDP81DRAFT_390295 [Colletotrichum phormii]KAK1640972.1 hypothetical protein BDP81DRAFT_390295 [Colletotrichum phormii]
MKNILRQLERLKKLDLSDVEIQILDILAYDIRAATWETAAEAASSLDALCPRLEQRKEAESYFYVTWDLMTDTATSFDVTKETQNHLTNILLALQQCAKGESNIWGNEADRQPVWKDLPLFYVAVEASPGDPTQESTTESFTTKDAQEWRNINRFGALLLGSGVLGLHTQAMDALRSALEEEPSSIPAVAECRLRLACEWIRHSARSLLWWSQENIGYLEMPEYERDLTEEAISYQGVLYEGPPIMCRQRWEFWMVRLEWLAKSEDAGLGKEMRTKALEAFEIMMEVGEWIGHTL